MEDFESDLASRVDKKTDHNINKREALRLGSALLHETHSHRLPKMKTSLYATIATALLLSFTITRAKSKIIVKRFNKMISFRC
jgi:hypothetical protein